MEVGLQVYMTFEGVASAVQGLGLILGDKTLLQLCFICLFAIPFSRL